MATSQSTKLTDKEKNLVRRAYLTGVQDMFTELEWDEIYGIAQQSDTIFVNSSGRKKKKDN